MMVLIVISDTWTEQQLLSCFFVTNTDRNTPDSGTVLHLGPELFRNWCSAFEIIQMWLLCSRSYWVSEVRMWRWLFRTPTLCSMPPGPGSLILDQNLSLVFLSLKLCSREYSYARSKYCTFWGLGCHGDLLYEANLYWLQFPGWHWILCGIWEWL